MARLLIKNGDNTSPNPDLDARCWKDGDVVVVMPDGHEWGELEGPPKFRRVDLPGVEVSEAERFCRPEKDENGELLARSQYRHSNSRSAFVHKRTREETRQADLPRS